MGNCIDKHKNYYIEGCNEYTFENGKLECSKCSGSYSRLNISNHYLCFNDLFLHCEQIINIGEYSSPIYSCNKCYSDLAEVLYYNGVKVCSYDFVNYRCKEGYKNTSYYKDIDICTKCKEPYILSYNEYYDKKICKDLYEEEPKSYYTIKSYEFDTGISTVDGKCDKGYFTRNGKVCIKCDDQSKGMSGCGGDCEFKINREYQLKCEENKCKEGYFETLPGICQSCEDVLTGCTKCKYIEGSIEKYPVVWPIRQRKLICDMNCVGNNVFQVDNICYKCEDLYSNCIECINDNNNIKCKTAKKGYYINKNGDVAKCEINCDECELVIKDGFERVECLKITNNHCFINSEGKVKYCADEYEGIKHCSLCSKRDKLKCISCDDGYMDFDGKCYSCEEVLDNKGCNYCTNSYYDDSVICKRCDDDYTLINNLGKCTPKNEEIQNCTTANLISTDRDNFYNCTYCSYDYLLIKDLKNKTNCYLKDDVGDVKNNCYRIINIKTNLEPVFSCEKCYSSYTIIIDENTIQKCIYQSNDLQYCKKALKKTILDEISGTYKDVYNCTECEENKELEYDINTNKMLCKTIKCYDKNCKVCKYDNKYICQECNYGYVFNKLSQCILKLEIIPNIYFKDIYRFALNGNTQINGENIFGPIYTIRGITKDNIVEMHSLIIKSILSLQTGSRNLEETKSFTTYCKYTNKIDNTETNLKFVDYECVVDSENQELNNYKLKKLEEGQFSDKGNLIAYDLENLVSKVEDPTKSESLYTSNNLNKYITFSINENEIKLETSNSSEFIFVVEGKTDKNLEELIVGELKIKDKNDIKANCEVDAKNKNNATLNCFINLETIINNSSEVLTFEDDEILSEEHNVLFLDINKIEIFAYKIIEEEIKDNTFYGANDEDKTDLIIGLTVGLGVPALIATIIIGIYFYKKKKRIIVTNAGKDLKISKFEKDSIRSERNMVNIDNKNTAN